MITGGKSTAHARGDIVLLPFPFRDLDTTKVRPAVVISGKAYNRQGDLIVAAITTHPPRFPTGYRLSGWKEANLIAPSIVRMQLATVAEESVLHSPGKVNRDDLVEIEKRLSEVFELDKAKLSASRDRWT